jgi:two-component system heavy metal sensor histidine kinase CusS
MSLNSAHEHGNSTQKPWSLATRLTAWYAASAFALVLATGAFLYWTALRNLDREDDRLLGDRARVLVSVLKSRPGDSDALRREVLEEWDAHQRTQLHVRILESDGQTLIETPGMGRLLPSPSFPPPETEPTSGADVAVANAGSFRVMAIAAAPSLPNGDSYIIQVAMDRSLETELADDYRNNLILVLSVGILACAIVGYAIAHRGIKPIHGITALAARSTSTNLTERMIPAGLPAEFLALAATINQMLDRLEDSFTRLSRFSADIAHELRTPVSSLRGEIEVALGKRRSPDEYRDVLGSSLEECSRLSRLIDRLLFLARAENPRTQIVKETCSLQSELATVGDFYQAAASEVNVRLIVEVEPAEAIAEVDRSLFQRAVGNLIANALAHTPAQGTITVRGIGDEQFTRIEVQDTGSGIPASHLPHVFDRFYRCEEARTSQKGNVGLGLAIVRSIVELHEGTVRIASDEGKGTWVSIIFPRRTNPGV